MTATASLAVEIGGLRLRNPFMAASGTCGYGVEIAHVVDLSTIGAIVTKGLYMAARDNFMSILKAAPRRKRLESLNLYEDVKFCLTPDQSTVIPVLQEGALVRMA